MKGKCHHLEGKLAYVLWHDDKDSVELTITSTEPYKPLAEDPQWLAFLAAHRDIEGLVP